MNVTFQQKHIYQHNQLEMEDLLSRVPSAQPWQAGEATGREFYIFGINMLHYTKSGKASSSSNIHHSHVTVTEISRLQCLISHILSLWPEVCDIIIHNRQKPIEPKCLFLVLEEPRLRSRPREGHAECGGQLFF